MYVIRFSFPSAHSGTVKLDLQPYMPNTFTNEYLENGYQYSDAQINVLGTKCSILYLQLAAASCVNRGSYMSAHVLLNLLNKLGKRDKTRGLPSILSLFRNKFNKFNNTRAGMLDSIYHMTLRLLWNIISAIKTSYFCHYVRNVVMDVITFPENL